MTVRKLLFVASLPLLLVAGSARAETLGGDDTCPGYIEGYDGLVLEQAAIAAAKSSGRRILFEVGTNGYVWCRALCDTFQKFPYLVALREKGYVHVKVDIGLNDRNHFFMKKYHLGDTGSPSFIVLDTDGRFLVHEELPAYEVPGVVGFVPEKLAEFLKAWAPGEPKRTEASTETPAPKPVPAKTAKKK